MDAVVIVLASIVSAVIVNTMWLVYYRHKPPVRVIQPPPFRLPALRVLVTRNVEELGVRVETPWADLLAQGFVPIEFATTLTKEGGHIIVMCNPVTLTIPPA